MTHKEHIGKLIKDAETGNGVPGVPEFVLGQIFHDEKNFDQAVLWLEKAVHKNNGDAADFLALMFLYGIGVGKDSKKAFSLFQKTSELGCASGTNNLGVCYAKGEGVEKNARKAFDLFKVSASKGWQEASYNLAQCYVLGLGTDKSEEEARVWFHKASIRARKEVDPRIENEIARFMQDPKEPQWIRSWRNLSY